MKDKLVTTMGAILRQNYLEKIERYLGKDTIVILTGQRRVGKSYILRLFRDKVYMFRHRTSLLMNTQGNVSLATFKLSKTFTPNMSSQ